jgi:hypothetical protein
MQHFLKPPPGTSRAEVVAPELLDQFLVLVYDAGSVLQDGL